ncbi:Rho termination factor N-terminal domain-containing protein [Methanoculleus frigidifontis]|nr:Rho termination factor N-terminal domain-containing protein [Methanoculleus sp. FWC-SCC1]
MATRKQIEAAKENIRMAHEKRREMTLPGLEKPTPAQQRARKENIKKAQDARRYESWTKRELYERAQNLGIDGRSRMTKDELIEALRAR